RPAVRPRRPRRRRRRPRRDRARRRVRGRRRHARPHRRPPARPRRTLARRRLGARRVGDLGGDPIRRLHFVLTALAAVVSSALLAALWNVLGWAPRTMAGYELTQYLAPATWGFAAAYAVVAGLLGWITRRAWPVALGMILIRPI